MEMRDSHTRLNGCRTLARPQTPRARDQIRTCLLAIAILGIASTLYSAEHSSSVLSLQLVVFQGLSSGQTAQLRKSVVELWASQDITIEWAPMDAMDSVRVMVDRPIPGGQGDLRDECWNVASTRVINGRVAPHVYASVDAAERVLASANPSFSTRSLGSLMLVRVLSRAIAHELAHYLLDTRTHTARGLLRARFTADEFVSSVQGPFRLEREQLALARKHPLMMVRAFGG